MPTLIIAGSVVQLFGLLFGCLCTCNSCGLSTIK